jgi:hypothetical protein
MLDPRIQDLLDWESATGCLLPMDITRILEFEDQGHIVDLITGKVIQNGASDTFILSVIGEAELLAHDLEPMP